MHRKTWLMGGLVCLLSLLAVPASAQFVGLTKRMPDGANTMILIDVNRVHNSPIGLREGWKEDHQKNFEAGLTLVPPDSDKFLSAAKLDWETMTPVWEVTLMNLDHEPNMAEVATRFQGTADNISGRAAAVIPGDIYAVKFSGTIAAVGWPARRADVTRWINRYDNGLLDGPSPYLKDAQKFAEASAPILMAMDMTHVLSPEEVKHKLQQMEVLKGKEVNLDDLANGIASIRGVALGITFTDKIYGAIRVNFQQDVTVLGPYAKDILLTALGNNGAMIDEFTNWEARVESKAIQITGELSDSGLRRVLSFVETPVSLRDAKEASARLKDDPQQKQQLVIQSTKQYFSAIDSMLADLRRNKSDRKTMGQLSVWFGNFARKIDRLPMLNVDPEMLGYGEFVSESLRGGQSDVTSAAAKSRIRQQEVPEQYDIYSYSSPIGVSRGRAYGWGGWRAVPNVRRESQMRTKVRTQQRLEGTLSANDVLREIESASRDIRTKMTQKYSAEF